MLQRYIALSNVFALDQVHTGWSGLAKQRPVPAPSRVRFNGLPCGMVGELTVASRIVSE
jgi:hypothetical protein